MFVGLGDSGSSPPLSSVGEVERWMGSKLVGMKYKVMKLIDIEEQE